MPYITIQRKCAEEARNEPQDLMAAAEKGRTTIIARHSRSVAALVPISAYGSSVRQPPLLPLKGSGLGLLGRNSTKTFRQISDEWNRIAFDDLLL